MARRNHSQADRRGHEYQDGLGEDDATMISVRSIGFLYTASEVGRVVLSTAASPSSMMLTGHDGFGLGLCGQISQHSSPE